MENGLHSVDPSCGRVGFRSDEQVFLERLKVYGRRVSALLCARWKPLDYYLQLCQRSDPSSAWIAHWSVILCTSFLRVVKSDLDMQVERTRFYKKQWKRRAEWPSTIRNQFESITFSSELLSPVFSLEWLLGGVDNGWRRKELQGEVRESMAVTPKVTGSMVTTDQKVQSDSQNDCLIPNIVIDQSK